MYECHLFEMEAEEAFRNAKNDLELVEDYGPKQYDNILHGWMRGGRSLYHCKVCDRYILRQETIFDDIDHDEHYISLWPVAGEKEADKLNRTVGGDIGGYLHRISLREVAITGEESTYSKVE